MVITLLLLPQKEAGRLNTLVKFQPEFTPIVGQCSAGNNNQVPNDGHVVGLNATIKNQV
jgi:hypothetical protein